MGAASFNLQNHRLKLHIQIGERAATGCDSEFLMVSIYDDYKMNTEKVEEIFKIAAGALIGKPVHKCAIIF